LGYPHAQFPCRNGLHPTVGSPGALFQNQPAPFGLGFLPLGHFRGQLIEQLATPVGAVGHRQATAQDQHPDNQQPAAARGQADADIADGGLGLISHLCFSATRNTALRARGLAAISAADGLIALPTSFRLVWISASRTGRPRGKGSPLASRRMNCLTWRSSREWKLTTARRPPRARTSSAARRPSARSSSSRLMKMRIPWNARVAGCLCFSRAGLATLITSARSAVRVNGCSARRLTIARAIRREKRSSPYSQSTVAISASAALLIQSAALWPTSGFMRISSGPSLRKLKPRSGSSSCGEDTPRSSSTPSTWPY